MPGPHHLDGTKRGSFTRCAYMRRMYRAKLDGFTHCRRVPALLINTQLTAEAGCSTAANDAICRAAPYLTWEQLAASAGLSCQTDFNLHLWQRNQQSENASRGLDAISSVRPLAENFSTLFKYWADKATDSVTSRVDMISVAHR